MFYRSHKIDQTIVNLAEQHGKEGVITQSYREYMHELDMKDVQYVLFPGYLKCNLMIGFGKDIMNMISTSRPKE